MYILLFNLSRLNILFPKWCCHNVAKPILPWTTYTMCYYLIAFLLHVSVIWNWVLFRKSYKQVTFNMSVWGLDVGFMLQFGQQKKLGRERKSFHICKQQREEACANTAKHLCHGFTPYWQKSNRDWDRKSTGRWAQLFVRLLLVFDQLMNATVDEA